MRLRSMLLKASPVTSYEIYITWFPLATSWWLRTARDDFQGSRTNDGVAAMQMLSSNLKRDTMTNQIANLTLHYTIMCEDVRVEINHKLSLMGILYAIQVPQLPVTLLKLVILNHWSGDGQFLSEVRILTPDRAQPVAVSAPSPFQVPQDGYADNVTIFANVTFPVPGNYVIQSLINSNVYAEQTLQVTDGQQQAASVVTSETIQ